jgi:hypothetical protein
MKDSLSIAAISAGILVALKIIHDWALFSAKVKFDREKLRVSQLRATEKAQTPAPAIESTGPTEEDATLELAEAPQSFYNSKTLFFGITMRTHMRFMRYFNYVVLATAVVCLIRAFIIYHSPQPLTSVQLTNYTSALVWGAVLLIQFQLTFIADLIIAIRGNVVLRHPL